MPDATSDPVARPWAPLAGRRRRRKAGDLEALRRELWHAVWRVGEVLDDPNADVAELLRAANALAALGNAYRAATEASDLVPRLEALEARLETRERP